MAQTNSDRRKRVTVLFSGRGSNMAVLIKAAKATNYPAGITRAITNVPDAGGLAITAEHGIETAIVDHRGFDSRQAHEAALEAEIAKGEPDIICLAGYMRILSADFVGRWRGRILNIHPSLLPSFKGTDTHTRALKAGVRLHGASVHFVDETLDGGPIIAQAAVPVRAGDTEETLAARVLTAEHLLYPHALRLVASGMVQLTDEGVAMAEAAQGADPAPFIWPQLPDDQRI